MSERITMVLQGGIGNQLFQYCAGLAIAAKLGGELWLTDVQENKHSGKDYRPLLYIRGKALGIDDDEEDMPSHYIQQKDTFEVWDPTEYASHPAIMLKGYYQYLPAIESQIPYIREDIYNRLSGMRAMIRERYRMYSPRQSCFIHVRRGDYLKLDPKMFWVQDESYFIPAIQRVMQRATGPKRWFVLSDDIDWCKQQPWLTVAPFEMVEEKDELVGLMLMSMCEGGAVISNSTYSWWGATFGCTLAGAPVVYPAKWIGEEKPKLFPRGWIQM
ncbi:alpha-1,2-fucosyltransferase [bacterium]|nr:alpha-1,2-fucosyltransferase [bacterium]